MTTAVFSEAFDTVRTSNQELALAESLLKLAMIGPDGAILSTTHAIDSSLLLNSEVAGNTAFRALVQSGRLRFALWPDGKSPSQALKTVLGMNSYRLSGWPEFISEPTLRRLALEVWNGSLSTTGVDSLDERIHLAQLLFDAVETSEKHFPHRLEEKRRSQLFAASLARAPKWLPKGETPKELTQAVLDLSGFVGRNSRSKVYDWIDKRDMPTRARSLLKDLVDARYNKTVADSLGLPFFSVRRVWKKLPSNYHESKASFAALELYEPLHSSSILAPVTWETVNRVVAPYGSEPYSKENAIEAFKQLLAGIVRYKRSLSIAGAVVSEAGAKVVHSLALKDAAFNWFTVILTALAMAMGIGGFWLGEKAGSLLDKNWQSKKVQAYSGWLDATPRN